MERLPITVVMITLDEESNIPHAIESVRGWTNIFMVDSGSTDRTTQIAHSMGARVVHHEFEDYASQRNWAIDNEPFNSEWILILDADEVILPDLKNEILDTTSTTTCDGFYMKRRFYFMGRWIKYGGEYPYWTPRLFRKQRGVYARGVNEYPNLYGTMGYMKHDFADINRNGVGAWIAKHNRYAEMEAKELIYFNQRRANGAKDEVARFWGSQTERKRWIREYIWNPLLPPLVRPFCFFLYCYIFRLGFLDGKAGFIYRVLHGFWYKFLIDVKYIEMSAEMSGDPSKRVPGERQQEDKTRNGL